MSKRRMMHLNIMAIKKGGVMLGVYCLLCLKALAQDDYELEYAEAIQSARPDTIYRIVLRGKQWTNLPDSIYLFKQLRALVLADTRLQKIPKKLRSLKKLKTLEIFRNGIDSRYFQQDTLLVQRLWQIGQSLIEKSPHRMTRLQDSLLNAIGRRTLRYLPPVPNVLQFPRGLRVQTLNYSGSWSGQALSRSLTRLRYLREVILNNQALEQLPSWIMRWRRLESLTINQNNLTHLGGLAWQRFKRLERLQFINNQIKELTPSLGAIKRLRVLNLSTNLLTALPSSLAQRAQSLDTLVLYKNQFTQLPSVIYSLKNLVELDLAYNYITEIQPDIRQLSRLKYLYLSDNKLVDVPSELGSLSDLEGLYLHHNYIVGLPETFSTLSRLRYLRINNNPLTEFPSWITHLSQLEDLDIAFTQISNLPDALRNLPKLHLFYFNNTPAGGVGTPHRALIDALKVQGAVVKE